jgi:hypothetical protein
MNEQEKFVARTSINRLQELSGVSTSDGDSDGDSLAPKRRSRSTRDESKRKSESSGWSPAPDSQFINSRCVTCNHPRSIHFEAKDEIGIWMFCSLEKCECFIDWKNNADA